MRVDARALHPRSESKHPGSFDTHGGLVGLCERETVRMPLENTVRYRYPDGKFSLSFFISIFNLTFILSQSQIILFRNYLIYGFVKSSSSLSISK